MLQDVSACLLHVFKATLQGPDLKLCRKDVNTVLGEMDAEQATLDYQSIAPEMFVLLSNRLVVGRIHPCSPDRHVQQTRSGPALGATDLN